MKRFFIFALTLMVALPMFAQTSPNGKIRAEYTSGRGLVISYRQSDVWQVIAIVASPYDTPSRTQSFKVDYPMLYGKCLHPVNAYTQTTYTRKGDEARSLTVRVYNDGVAFRGLHDYRINLSTARNTWLQRWSEGYEDFYPQNRTTHVGERYGYPALFEYGEGVFALLSESDITPDCAASSMWATDRGLQFELRPDGAEDGGYQTLIIGSLSDVVESTLITDNSSACQYDDTSWIRPGVASWVYWAYNHGSNDYNIIRRYVDMARDMHLPYVLIDAEWDDMPKVASNQGKTIEDAIAYALSCGVRPLIWYNSSTAWINGAPGPKFRLNEPESREREFAWLESLGVAGVKIDFFAGDTHATMAYMIDLLRSAARHHLLVNFHGATIPRGWQRTYPNLVSVEGVYGAEWYNNVPTFTDRAASHNATLPFTRNVVGSMDYTPCAFSDSQHPHITTHAHELALTVLYESGILHLADRPESFLAQPKDVQDFLSELPTAWDETRFLCGYPGRSVVMARRSGRRWYIAGINGTDAPTTLTFSTSRLHKLGQRVTMYADADKTKNVTCNWDITRLKQVPTSVDVAPRGGFILVVDK